MLKNRLIKILSKNNVAGMSQLSLFNSDEYFQFPEELLEYTEHFLDAKKASKLEKKLLETTPWKQNTQKIYNKTVQTPRLTAWYGNAGKSYHLGGNEFMVNQWSPELLNLKKKIEKATGYEFNSVLLNLYRDGNDSVAWHRDKESELGNRPAIASVSLGQVRNFDFRKVDDHNKKHSLPLQHGSLLIMKGDLQLHWEHRIAKSAQPLKPRINLTFRMIREISTLL
ncbi:alpha-ketoglutarate-dependent dioxygenase AlkB [Chryseobacterium sp. SSA4.19]|uniref:alpha-ketoglutarate-dependent dioxygenase AlkB family protein n=1 Tax=Chryseobacterium sp. SSA4.19 TaxID=2919915 RepID=UPI001F4F88AA|nr:alpha-ketoglutarate-dependent dioxygenase AlkB [Chryseobacterium sp. SSA4.19]MCJ8154068.1 alpha-ketoglutarate-dependent dioxygenase AlkB [Chryseobacterium sp. SSA4.19]